jgi:hypothetical protein
MFSWAGGVFVLRGIAFDLNNAGIENKKPDHMHNNSSAEDWLL